MTVSATRVAIVGSACRLPSADGLDAFWQVLVEGRSVITEVQEERFGTQQHRHPNRNAPGRSVSFAAGQLERPYDFDPTYFGISPREAATMDPQQRIMLEVAVEALENAGIPVDALAGEAVGVYVGASSLDYGTSAQLDTASMVPQSMTGNTLSIIANRLSYAFDLSGPSYVVDTACSSSLIALHNAITDIEAGRIDTAIVGGVSMLLHPVPFIGFSQASMLSANGLCRAFDADADGYVRSEGAVALVIRAESRARANGDPIRARLLASGVNSDGRTAGLSLPSGRAQAALLRRVYGAGELEPTRLAFVEAHGTGTPIGDPIEAEALGTVLAAGRSEPLLIGSAKSNFGHLEPASGLVGVLKAQLALANDCLPASLHCGTPNPAIPFEALNLAVARAPTALPRDAGPRLAGVNSFGFGGANAHVVLEDGEPPAEALQPNTKPAPILISAASKAALRALASASADRLERAGDAALYANALAHGRARLAHRAVLAPADVATTAARLRAVAADEKADGVSVGEAAASAQQVVFLYSGNGSQWAGMGRRAYREEPDFKRAFEQVDSAFISFSGWSLVTMLSMEELESEIERTGIAQPLLFALQVALTDALRQQGLAPAAVIGHSVGEVAAAWASGALTLHDAVGVIHARSTHQEVTRHLGGMAALLLPAEAAQAAIAPFAGLELAAINSERSVTISGPNESLHAFTAAAKANSWTMRRLNLDYPFHCALVDPIRDPLVAALAEVKPQPSRTAMVSTVTGEVIAGEKLGARYWWDNVRLPVRFADAVRSALETSHLFVEIGPRPVLTTYVRDVARSAQKRATVLPSFVQKDEVANPVARTVERVLAHGGSVDDKVVFGAKVASADMLPSYPWQHAHYRSATTVELTRLREPREHPLLGERLRLDQHDWRVTLDAARLPFLADHTVDGAIVFPAAGFAEMALAVGRIRYPGAAIEVRDLDLVAALILDEVEEREVRTREYAPGSYLVESRRRLSDDGWMVHAKATVGPAPSSPSGLTTAPTERVRSGEGEARDTISADQLYALTARLGLPYGPAFRRAQKVVLHGVASGTVELADPLAELAEADFVLDPTLFDSCFHALFAFLADTLHDGEATMLPVRIGSLTMASGAATPTRADVEITMADPHALVASFTLCDAKGAIVARADGVRFQRLVLSRSAEGSILRAEPLRKRISRSADPSQARPILAYDALDGAEVEPSEDALLVEAGVQAAAGSALRPLLGTPASLAELAAQGRVARSALPLAARLLHALEASGQVEEDHGRWRFVGEPIELADVVSLLVAEHPERLAEAAFLSALPEWLAGVFADGLAEDGLPLADPLLAELLTDAPYSAPLYGALLDALADVLPEDEGASCILVIGAANMAFLRSLADRIDVSYMRLIVTDRDQSVLERAELVWSATPGVEFKALDKRTADDHPFDVIILAPTLAHRPDLDEVRALLKPSGVVLGAGFAPTLMSDALGGLAKSWWSRSVDLESPAGALPDREEWQGALVATGLQAVTVTPIRSALTDGLIFLGQSAGALAGPLPLTLPSLHAMGESGRKTLAAIAALDDANPKVADLSAPAKEGPPAGCLIAIDETDFEALPDVLATLGAFLVGLGPEPRAVTLVTFGAHAHGEPQPCAAAIAAFGRVALNELTHLELRIVDLAPDFDPSVAAVRLAAELAQPNAEREIILSRDDRAAVRYVPSRPAARAGDVTRLAIERRGSIDNLAYVADRMGPLGPGEVRLKVETTGLNFRDVMWTLGLLPYEALQDGFAGATLGMECAGIVDAAGEDVTDLAPGDRVVAFAPASFASHVTVSAEAVIARPQGLGASAAATIPVAFMTAYYALIELGALEEGESVLIHGGAGGVGLAALQIAKWRGAKVFATAGTVEKRALLRQLGADHVFDSRSLAFAHEVMSVSGGEGVDVVLNSLAGEAMERSLATLKPFGRFLELGKRDFYADTKLGLRPFRQNLSYFGIDADQLMKHRPQRAKRLLATVMALFEEGELTALPHRTFPAEGVRDAFRLMQHAGHIGKIVVAAPEPRHAEAVATPTRIAPDKAYLLVGGTSGFGFATAEWLIGEGARHLTLASRFGVKDEAIAAAIATHRAAGVSIEVADLDVTDRDAVRALIARITAERALGGVFHMAMVLDDALIPSLDAKRYHKAMAPKVAGAEALDAATRDVPHDLFVIYSSITAELGNPGQANYVAANAYIEALGRRRRAAGRPVLALAWGAIGDVGVLARDLATSEILQRKLGRHTITARQALAALKSLLEEGAMGEGPAVRLVGKVDWTAARKDLRIVASPSFEDLADLDGARQDDDGGIALAERLAGLTEAEAIAEVAKLLTAEISHILKLPSSEVDVHKPLTEIGMDSLMGLELRMAAEERLGIDIPTLSLGAGASVADLSRKVVQRVRGEAGEADVAIETLADRHVGARQGEDLTELAEAMRERADGMRTILK